MKFKFEELRVYQEAIACVSDVFTLTKTWPPPYKYSLADQLQRAALSISLNIAEGSSRTTKDFQHFLSVSRRSSYECAALVQVARKEQLLSENEYLLHYDRVYTIAKMLSSLKTSISPTK